MKQLRIEDIIKRLNEAKKNNKPTDSISIEFVEWFNQGLEQKIKRYKKSRFDRNPFNYIDDETFFKSQNK